ncbi:hypothetical protein DM860_003489 [Cuscuta australis]|uniref:Seipin n=1 Tax=Cuscuta australis TaxID=267555 RepID=A0A328DHR2_9ASTE|nr:hypothetical protein DM860_003489 [Cuscuta australis]
MGFGDAADEFPFDDCSDVFSDADMDGDGSVTFPDPKLKSENRKSCSPATLRRRRRSVSRSSSCFDSPDVSSVVSADNVSSLKGTSLGCSNDFKEIEKQGNMESHNMNGDRKPGNIDPFEVSSSSGRVESVMSEERNPNSVIMDGETEHDSFPRADLNTSETDDSSILVVLSDLVIKAITLQVNLLLIVFSFTTKFFLCPIRTIYSIYMFVMDPFCVARQLKQYLLKKCVKVFSYVFGNALSLVSEWLKERRSFWRLGMKCGWGLLCSIYVAVLLMGLLVLGFATGGFLISHLVEEPMKMVENLNFDYTEKSPVAFVPITGCQGLNGKIDFRGHQPDVGQVDGMHFSIPPKHKLSATVSLTLPESDYNRNLGVFQVRVDLLTSNGMVLASSRRPCILHFKSQPIRLLSTFLKTASLITGYSSESQDLAVEFKGLTQGDMPTACVRVTIEQRAEFHPGGGLPQLYAASLVLESQLPLLQRLIWYWKTTLFVWISLTLFSVELVFALLCCKPLIFPRIRLMQAPPTENLQTEVSESPFILQ